MALPELSKELIASCPFTITRLPGNFFAVVKVEWPQGYAVDLDLALEVFNDKYPFEALLMHEEYMALQRGDELR